MKVKINDKEYQLYKSPLFGEQYIFQYTSENCISMIVEIMNEDEINKRIRLYYYGHKVPIIKNRELNGFHIRRNPESELLEMDFTTLLGLEPYIIDLSYNDKLSKYIIVDIEPDKPIDDLSNPGYYIGNRYRIKLKKMDHFRIKLEQYKSLNNKIDAIALLHDLLESIVSDLCIRNNYTPSNNFSQNLSKTIIDSNVEKEFIIAIKKLTGVFAHGNTSSIEERNNLSGYYDCIFYLMKNLLDKYYPNELK